MLQTLFRVALTITLVGTFSASSLSQTTEIALRKGESTDLHPVYWVRNCRSLLKGFVGVDVLEGPQGVTVAIRQEPVYARRQNCTDKVPGGTVVITADAVQEKVTATLRYRVRYDTEDGPKQSSHSVQLVLYP